MAYNNGNVSVEDVKKMQQALGVTVDGKWGPNSSAAAGGLNADDAWTEFQGGGWYNPNTSTNISKGSSGNEVLTLQQMLNSAGNYGLAEDGIFGDKTDAAVRDYQTNNNLAVDGIVGKNTWASLNSTPTTTPTTSTKPTTNNTPTTNTTPTTSNTPTTNTSNWSYDDFSVSDETAAADALRQTLGTQKPGDFTYDAYQKSDAVTGAETAVETHKSNKPGEFTYEDYEESQAVKDANAAIDNHKANKPGDFTYDAYQQSDIVQQANALLQQQLANKPGEYQSQWQNSLNEIMDKILNREKFSYDLNGDALYQQYKNQYTTQGQMAMMDTMGQAAALTGGYGSSYSQMVGQQAYQGYLQQLNDKVPELYQLALDQYNREGQELYNQYGLYADRENQDYGRYRDSVSDYYTDLNYLTEDYRYKSEDDYGRWYDKTNLDYGIHRDNVSDYNSELDRLTNDARYKAEDEYGKHMDAYNMAYGEHRDSVSDYYSDLDRLQEEARYLAQDEYGKHMDAYNMAYGEHRDSVADWQYEQNRADQNYWNLYDRDYNEYSSDRALDYDNYWNNTNLDYQKDRDAVDDEWRQKEFEEAQRQFNASQKSSSSSNSSSGNTTGNTSYTAPEGWDKNAIKDFQKKMGISVDGIWGPQSQKAYDEYYGGDGLNGARKEEIEDMVVKVLTNPRLSSSFKPDDWIKANGAFKSDEERAWAKVVFNTIAGIK